MCVLFVWCVVFLVEYFCVFVLLGAVLGCCFLGGAVWGWLFATVFVSGHHILQYLCGSGV